MGAAGSAQRGVARLRRAWARDPVAFAVRAALVALLVALAARLAFGDDPWSGGVAERLADGKPVRPLDYARTWGWWAAAGIAPVLLVLLLGVRRWLVRDDVAPVAALAPPPGPSRVFAAAVLGAVLAGAVLAWPRLGMGLFEDERYNVQWSIDGFFRVDRSGKLVFHTPSWSDTLWHYEWPNNHVPHTVLARLAVETWRAAGHPRPGLVNEAALRVPTFAAGLASIAVLALALRRLGYAAAGAAGAWLLALHPWHMRYASEARGYSLALLLLSLGILLLTRALHRGTWGRWLAFAASQLLLLWTYPGALWFAGTLNAVALLGLWRLHAGTPRLAGQVARWGIANLAGALVWAWMMAPNLAQLADYLARAPAGRLHASWYADVAAYLFVGMPWGRPGENPAFPELSDLAASTPVLAWLAAAVALAAVAAGALRLLRAGGLRAGLAAVAVLPPALALASMAGSGRGDSHLHPQYLILALPGLVMLLCLGLDGLASPLGRGARIAVLGAAVAGYAALTGAIRADLRTREIEPFRESVLLTRPILDPRTPENERIITVSFSFPPTYYDPRVQRIGRVAELRHWMRVADAEGRPLFVNVGRPGLAARQRPELMALVERADTFEEVRMLPGLSSRGQRQVFRYRGGGAAE